MVVWFLVFQGKFSPSLALCAVGGCYFGRSYLGGGAYFLGGVDFKAIPVFQDIVHGKDVTYPVDGLCVVFACVAGSC